MEISIKNLKSVSGSHIEYDGSCGLYVSARYMPKSGRAISRIAKELGISINQDKLHTTLIYSFTAPDYPVQDVILECERLDSRSVGQVVYADGVDVFHGHDGKYYTVLTVEAPLFHQFNTRLQEMGAVHSMPDFKPHITLTASETPPEGKADVYRLVSLNLRRVPLPLKFRVNPPSNLDD